MRTPGILNPLSFSSKKELQDALRKQGEEAGWTPMPSDDDDAPVDRDKIDE